MDNNFNNQQGFNPQGQNNFQGYNQSVQTGMNTGYNETANNSYQDNSGYDNSYQDNNGYNNGYQYNNGYGNGYPDNSGYDNGYQGNNGYDNGYQGDGGYYDDYQYDDGYYDDYQYGKPKKANPGVIVGLTLLFLVTIAAVTVLIVVFVKNGKDKDEDNQSTTSATAVTTTTMSTDISTTEAITTEASTEAITTEAPAPTPFAEVNGYAWNDPYAGLQLASYPFAAYDATGTKLTDDEIVFDNITGNYTFDNITKSAPDANGYVTITVPYTITTHIRLTSKETVTASYSATAYNRLFNYSDYYTGTQIKQGWDYNTGKWATDYVYTDITYNNQTFRIGVLVSDEYNFPEFSFVEENTVGRVYETTTERKITINFYVPADYDGLVLSITKEGYTDAWFNADSTADGTQTYSILGPDECGWTYTADQLYFFKVNDYIR